jgi:hypothetical protein
MPKLLFAANCLAAASERLIVRRGLSDYNAPPKPPAWLD